MVSGGLICGVDAAVWTGGDEPVTSSEELDVPELV